MTREEAIEVVKERLDYYEREKRLKAACEILIPELRESEDERIRRELIFFLKEEIPQCSIKEHADKLKEFVSYLEKQKEQKPAEWSVPKINGEPISTENQSVDISLAEWSEEDERIMNGIQLVLESWDRSHVSSSGLPSLVPKYISWLKSLRPNKQD